MPTRPTGAPGSATASMRTNTELIGQSGEFGPGHDHAGTALFNDGADAKRGTSGSIGTYAAPARRIPWIATSSSADRGTITATHSSRSIPSRTVVPRCDSPRRRTPNSAASRPRTHRGALTGYVRGQSVNGHVPQESSTWRPVGECVQLGRIRVGEHVDLAERRIGCFERSSIKVKT